MNLLIDENLSPRLVLLLAAKGVPAAHVVHLGMSGASDPKVWRYAFDHDQVVLTVNAADFLYLASAVTLHPGLVIIRAGGSLSRDEQWAWVEPVIDWILESQAPLVNKAVIVTGKGKFTCVALPSSPPG